MKTLDQANRFRSGARRSRRFTAQKVTPLRCFSESADFCSLKRGEVRAPLNDP